MKGGRAEPALAAAGAQPAGRPDPSAPPLPIALLSHAVMSVDYLERKRGKKAAKKAEKLKPRRERKKKNQQRRLCRGERRNRAKGAAGGGRAMHAPSLLPPKPGPSLYAMLSVLRGLAW